MESRGARFVVLKHPPWVIVPDMLDVEGTKVFPLTCKTSHWIPSHDVVVGAKLESPKVISRKRNRSRDRISRLFFAENVSLKIVCWKSFDENVSLKIS